MTQTCMCWGFGFNPRAHAGRDCSYIHGWPIHTGFNPRAHAGRDVPSQPTAQRIDKFQSTRPRGARQVIPDTKSRIAGFNPRAHAGRDELREMLKSSEVGFNPRAHAGRDVKFCLGQRNWLVSIHAPTRGATVSC